MASRTFLPRPVRPLVDHPVVRAVNPVTTGDAAQSNPTVTIVTLAATLILLNVWRSQHSPELRDVGKDFLLVIGLVAIGTVAPAIVTGVLWVALLFWVLRNGAAVEGLWRSAVQAIDSWSRS